MTIRVDWDTPARTAVRWDYEPGWTWTEYRRAAELTHGMIAAAGHVVDCLHHLQGTGLPEDSFVLTEWRRTVEDAPPNTGLIIVVEVDAVYLDQMARLFNHMQQDTWTPRILLADTLQEARADLAQARLGRTRRDLATFAPR